MRPDPPCLNSIFFDGMSERIASALARFLHFHPPDAVAVAGSIALAAQAMARGHPLKRSFGDIDLLATSFDRLNDQLAAEFLCPHVHPHAENGRILLQFVHPADAIRIDVFRAPAGCFERATRFRFGPSTVSMVSLEDQAAHAAALCLKICRGGSVAPKHLADFERMLPLLEGKATEAAWVDHRRVGDPERFLEAVDLIRRHVREHPQCVASEAFATDPSVVCQRCRIEGVFKPAPADQVLQILGYV